MRYKRDTKKRRFIEILAAQGTVFHAAQTAGVSRQAVYCWRIADREFAASRDEAHEQAVDAVESSLYQKALDGDTICMFFYLKAPPADVSRHTEHRHQTSAKRDRRENGAVA